MTEKCYPGMQVTTALLCLHTALYLPSPGAHAGSPLKHTDSLCSVPSEETVEGRWCHAIHHCAAAWLFICVSKSRQDPDAMPRNGLPQQVQDSQFGESGLTIRLSEMFGGFCLGFVLFVWLAGWFVLV